LVLDHLAPYPYLLATVERLQLLGRKVLEALRLDHGGEAAERRVEGEETRELRAAHAEDAALDHHLLAHLLLGLVPRNDGLGRADGDRPDDRQCASQPEPPRAPLDPAEAHSVKTAVTPTRPRSPTRSSRDARAHRPGPRPDPRDATLLGGRPPPRARAAALSHLRTLLLLSARRLSPLPLRRPRVGAGERTGHAPHLHRRPPRRARLPARDAVRHRDRRARGGAPPHDQPGGRRARSRVPADRHAGRGRVRRRVGGGGAAALPARTRMTAEGHGMRGRVAIVGVAESDEMGKLPHKSAFALHAEAARNALADAGLQKDDVDAVFTAGLWMASEAAEY